MRIHFWLPHYKIAGGTKVTLTYADLLARRGHDVRAYVPRPGLRERLFGRGTWRGRFRVPVHYVRSWNKACARECDAVVADSWQVAKALAACDTAAKKFEFIQHDERLYHGDPAAVERVYRTKELKKIVVATWLKELFEQEFGETPALVMNTVNREEFHTIPGLRTPGKTRILLLAHTYPWKGTREGVDIVTRLKHDHPEIRLIGFGVRAKKPPAGFDEYHHNPSPAELRALYASADLFLCPSWDEGFGLPSVEAMACGAALVTYDNGGSREYAKDGETAFVAPRRDTEALAEKLEAAVADKPLRRRIAEAGTRFIERMPTWEEQAAKLESILMA